MQTIIRTENLSKKYGQFTAVSGLALTISKREIYGFIGLNGAGKTTTIRMLLGMIKPTTGTVELFGRRINPNLTDVWSKVGFLVETATAYPELSVLENLEASRKLYKIADPKATVEVMDRLGLTRYSGKKAKHLSLGNYQRLSVARALLHKPELLILDEPTLGLDPAGIVEMRTLFLDLAQNEGVTIFISSHILEEIHRFVTRIGIIHEGLLIEEMDIGQLEMKMEGKLVLDAADRPKLVSVLKGLGHDLRTNDLGEVELSDSSLIQAPERLVLELVQEGVLLRKVNVQKEDLEEYFLSRVGSDG